MKSKTIKPKILIAIGICILLLPIMVHTLSSCFNMRNGDGTRIGQFVALTKKGIFCKTWEAEIIKGGLSGGSGGFGVGPFWLTIPDDKAEEVQGYLDSQKEVKIKYHTAGFYSPLSSDSRGNFLISVEPTAK
jgi:hypothetical protein